MDNDIFVAYVGDPDFHDGHVVKVEREHDLVRVMIRGVSSQLFEVTFTGVVSVESNHPEGMMLYSLSQMQAPHPLSKYIFVNWDENDDARLSIVAVEFTYQSCCVPPSNT